MRRILFIVVSILAVFSLNATDGTYDTFAYITNSELESGATIGDYVADLSLVLHMSDIISYDIGFSSNANALSPNRVNTVTISPTISSDFTTVSGHMENLYVYWNVISNLKLSFSINLSGDMRNGDSSIPWKIKTLNSDGGEVIIDTASSDFDDSLNGFKSIGDYALKDGTIRGYDLRNITIDIETNIVDNELAEGTYVGSIYLSVEVMS